MDSKFQHVIIIECCLPHISESLSYCFRVLNLICPHTLLNNSSTFCPGWIDHVFALISQTSWENFWRIRIKFYRCNNQQQNDHQTEAYTYIVHVLL